jgi:hypothetical protein
MQNPQPAESEKGQTFTNVDDTVLTSRVSGASQRIVFVSPGLRRPVAEALAEAMKRLPGRVIVVLDVDAEVCRLGYGDEEGLEFIKAATEAAGVKLLHQPGVRIGLLIVDGDTVVYSPVPLLIEAGSIQPDKPNAIVLTDTVPPAIESACGLGRQGEAGRQVGVSLVSDASLEVVKQDLKARPPKEFNVARIERVFNSELHFVELKILDYQLGSKKVTLDVELFGMGDDYLRERIENTFKPFNDAEFLTLPIAKVDKTGKVDCEKTEMFGPDVIKRERQQLKKEFLFDIPTFGVVVRRANKQAFEDRLKVLEERLKLYVAAVKANISGHLEKAKGRLKAPLISAVMQKPPINWGRFKVGNTLPHDEAERLVGVALDQAFAGIVPNFDPTIRWIYKDATYEMIHDAKFREGLEKHFGKTRTAELFSEHDAAPEQSRPSEG